MPQKVSICLLLASALTLTLTVTGSPRANAYSNDASEIARELRGLREEVARVRAVLERR